MYIFGPTNVYALDLSHCQVLHKLSNIYWPELLRIDSVEHGVLRF